MRGIFLAIIFPLLSSNCQAYTGACPVGPNIQEVGEAAAADAVIGAPTAKVIKRVMGLIPHYRTTRYVVFQEVADSSDRGVKLPPFTPSAQ